MRVHPGDIIDHRRHRGQGGGMMSSLDDGDNCCGMDSDTQVLCLGGSGCISGFGFLMFAIFYLGHLGNLGPDDQILVQTGAGRSVINGPGALYLKPFQKRTYRKALILEANEYATVRDRSTNKWRTESGPLFKFLGPNDELRGKRGYGTPLKKDEYVRLVDRRNGRETIVVGPGVFIPDVSQQSVHMIVNVERATALTDQHALIVRDRTSGALSLYTTCTHKAGLFFPTERLDVAEVRERVYVAAYEAAIVRDVEGKTIIYQGGMSRAEQEKLPGVCNSGSTDDEAGGFSFFVMPFSRIVRYSWSNHSRPPEKAMNLTSKTAQKTVVQRVRTSHVVKSHRFSIRPTVWCVASEFDTSRNVWPNRGSGPNLTTVRTAGSLTLARATNNRPSASLYGLQGFLSTRLDFGTQISGLHWTLCSISRFSSGTRRSIILGGTNWYHGHYAGQAGVAMYGRNVTQMSFDRVRPDTEWVVMCSTSQSETVSGAVNLNGDDIAVALPTKGPTRLTVNTNSRQTSDFEIAEIIGWRQALPRHAMQEAMEYLQTRIEDSALYVDEVEPQVQAGQALSKVVKIDLRREKSFFKFIVSTSDNVRLNIEGTFFWHVSNVKTMIQATSNPNGDAWTRVRSLILSQISLTKLDDFILQFASIGALALAKGQQDDFFSTRGLKLENIELTSFDPTDARTIASLRLRVENYINATTRMTKEQTRSEVSTEQLKGEISREADRTELIQVQAENVKREAETFGSTEGSRTAKTISAYVDTLSDMIPDVNSRTSLYEEHIQRESFLKATKDIFNRESPVILRPKNQSLTLVMPSKDSKKSERRLQKATVINNKGIDGEEKRHVDITHLLAGGESIKAALADSPKAILDSPKAPLEL